MILSIDVGIKNLALCMLNETSNLIVQWDVSGVPPESDDGLFKSIKNHLDDKEWVLEADPILIEKQPDRNKKMKTVEIFLHAYFLIKCPNAETIIYDARHKIPDVCGPGKAQYRKRKQTSINRCKEFLESNNTNAHWMDIFNKSKKKDDLADTVMQALSFGRRIIPKEKTKNKKLSSRKPTENQKETKYSKSNLVWLHNNNGKDKMEKDKRFMKDLKRYFKSYDDFLKHL